MDRNVASMLALGATAALTVTIAAVNPNTAYAGGVPAGGETGCSHEGAGTPMPPAPSHVLATPERLLVTRLAPPA